MAGATIRGQIRGGGAQLWAVTDDSLTSRAVPYGHGQLRLGPESVEKIVPSALRLASGACATRMWGCRGVPGWHGIWSVNTSRMGLDD
jgi:hypothetical protein